MNPLGGLNGVLLQAPDMPGKKSPKTRLFLFDLVKPPPYNPRPRCFAALAPKWCFSLILDVKVVCETLFDIVIIGRGTWAAARYATCVKGQTLTHKQSSSDVMNARVLLQK
jgi:hypothetical protein